MGVRVCGFSQIKDLHYLDPLIFSIVQIKVLLLYEVQHSQTTQKVRDTTRNMGLFCFNFHGHVRGQRAFRPKGVIIKMKA